MTSSLLDGGGADLQRPVLRVNETQPDPSGNVTVTGSGSSLPVVSSLAQLNSLGVTYRQPTGTTGARHLDFVNAGGTVGDIQGFLVWLRTNGFTKGALDPYVQYYVDKVCVSGITNTVAPGKAGAHCGTDLILTGFQGFRDATTILLTGTAPATSKAYFKPVLAGATGGYVVVSSTRVSGTVPIQWNDSAATVQANLRTYFGRSDIYVFVNGSGATAGFIIYMLGETGTTSFSFANLTGATGSMTAISDIPWCMGMSTRSSTTALDVLADISLDGGSQVNFHNGWRTGGTSTYRRVRTANIRGSGNYPAVGESYALSLFSAGSYAAPIPGGGFVDVDCDTSGGALGCAVNSSVATAAQPIRYLRVRVDGKGSSTSHAVSNYRSGFIVGDDCTFANAGQGASGNLAGVGWNNEEARGPIILNSSRILGNSQGPARYAIVEGLGGTDNVIDRTDHELNGVIGDDGGVSITLSGSQTFYPTLRASMMRGQDGIKVDPVPAQTGTSFTSDDVIKDQGGALYIGPAHPQKTTLAITAGSSVGIPAAAFGGPTPSYYPIYPTSDQYPSDIAPKIYEITLTQPVILFLWDAYSDDPYGTPNPGGTLSFNSTARVRLILTQDSVGGHDLLLDPPVFYQTGAEPEIATGPGAVTVIDLSFDSAAVGWVVERVVRGANPRRTLLTYYATARFDALVSAGMDTANMADTVTEMTWLSTKWYNLIKNAALQLYLVPPLGLQQGASGQGNVENAGGITRPWARWAGIAMVVAGLTSPALYNPRVYAKASIWRSRWSGTTPPAVDPSIGASSPFIVLHEFGHVIDGLALNNLPSGVPPPLTPTGQPASDLLSTAAEFQNFYVNAIANNSAASNYAKTNSKEMFAELTSAAHYDAFSGTRTVLDGLTGSQTNSNTWLALIAKYGLV